MVCRNILSELRPREMACQKLSMGTWERRHEKLMGLQVVPNCESVRAYFGKKGQGQIHLKGHYISDLRVSYFRTGVGSVEYIWVVL